jgi:hypothetical protein
VAAAMRRQAVKRSKIKGQPVARMQRRNWSLCGIIGRNPRFFGHFVVLHDEHSDACGGISSILN